MTKITELTVSDAKNPRAGWDVAFAIMGERGDDELLDIPTTTTWDEASDSFSVTPLANPQQA